jgi:hypothetical protein
MEDAVASRIGPLAGGAELFGLVIDVFNVKMNKNAGEKTGNRRGDSATDGGAWCNIAAGNGLLA